MQIKDIFTEQNIALGLLGASFGVIAATKIPNAPALIKKNLGITAAAVALGLPAANTYLLSKRS